MGQNPASHASGEDSTESNHYQIEIGSELNLENHDTVIEAFEAIDVDKLRLVDQFGNVVTARELNSYSETNETDEESDNVANEEDQDDEEETPNCPNCGASGAVYARETKTPKYRCGDCKKEFAEEVDEYDFESNHPTCEVCGAKVSKGFIGSNRPHSYEEYASGEKSVQCRECGDRPWETDHHDGVVASDSNA